MKGSGGEEALLRRLVTEAVQFAWRRSEKWSAATAQEVAAIGTLCWGSAAMPLAAPSATKNSWR